MATGHMKKAPKRRWLLFGTNSNVELAGIIQGWEAGACAHSVLPHSNRSISQPAVGLNPPNGWVPAATRSVAEVHDGASWLGEWG